MEKIRIRRSDGEMKVSMCYFTAPTGSESGSRKIKCCVIKFSGKLRSDRSAPVFEPGPPVSHRIQTTCLMLHDAACLRTVVLGWMAD